ncbi:tumor necrosis factor ligand superfamily member 10-like [Leucoraja erinacea]|uniref:tumor necrosis factor ligand superfamily member 10-like n=1 Tax=Leucoraja erinaceus TaxID=7782 RepID=UPI002455D7C5|nr:tumor necrosis factor ligand superfamily member 10-like [Leucoraja erinacea]
MAGQYSRSCSSESAAQMLSPDPRTPVKSKLILGVVTGGVALLMVQVCATAGLFIYFTREISKIKNQTASQELWCLSNPDKLQQLFRKETEDINNRIGEDPCWILANKIKLLANKVTEKASKQRISKDIINNLPPEVFKSTVQLDDQSTYRPSAHLTVRDGSLPGLPNFLDTSCRHIVKWGIRDGLSYIRNMTINHGKLQASQKGRYYIYSQTYFRYPQKDAFDLEDQPAKPNEQPLVQCIYKTSASYPSPILLMKSVGTKCWAANAEYGLNSIYQGGLFELDADDEIFVTVSDRNLLHYNVQSSYFGSFRLDV